ncbi:hypothetical protein BO94DRAFT_539222 [Aspergillus sclerotioniger CBS 115572]|uniref:Uncharacterized protein n=1 Tax=Aspergillus sclerotioniger CBS 115572 TaxID=1450535 RepID=A0A317VH98_9EURO|nr:hypothetical protein BO94DRAFT_539222 [Aspergillus sclerotioniger CBS 115572]PWY72541.1 hypothetical protein BO94DRAFT_539222 [Aspergillus sclerotioniger CBS 115572]
MASLSKDHRGTDTSGDEQCQVELPTKGLKSPQDTSQSSGSLRYHDWDQLQEEYIDSMEKHERAEQELRGHVSQLLEIFMAWSETTITRDELRALKRFKTQMQHVQTSEESLELKRRHYVDVVKAFESALALLNDRINS